MDVDPDYYFRQSTLDLYRIQKKHIRKWVFGYVFGVMLSTYWASELLNKITYLSLLEFVVVATFTADYARTLWRFEKLKKEALLIEVFHS